MRAGLYRLEAVFEREQQSGALDAFGHEDGSDWVELFRAMASLRAQPGRERIEAGRQEAPVSATLRMVYVAPALALTSGDRVIIDGDIWSILSAPTDTRGTHQELEIVIQRGAGVT